MQSRVIEVSEEMGQKVKKVHGEIAQLAKPLEAIRKTMGNLLLKDAKEIKGEELTALNIQLSKLDKMEEKLENIYNQFAPLEGAWSQLKRESKINLRDAIRSYNKHVDLTQSLHNSEAEIRWKYRHQQQSSIAATPVLLRPRSPSPQKENASRHANEKGSDFSPHKKARTL